MPTCVNARCAGVVEGARQAAAATTQTRTAVATAAWVCVCVYDTHICKSTFMSAFGFASMIKQVCMQVYIYARRMYVPQKSIHAAVTRFERLNNAAMCVCSDRCIYILALLTYAFMLMQGNQPGLLWHLRTTQRLAGLLSCHVIWDGALCWSVIKPIMPACLAGIVDCITLESKSAPSSRQQRRAAHEYQP
jgi:hypothetical protein